MPSASFSSGGTATHLAAPSDAIHYEQLRIGQICSILIRNLTLRPNRDRALRSLANLTSQPGHLASNATTSADDADLALRIGRSNSKGKARAKAIRRRSSSWSRDDNTAGGSDHEETVTRHRRSTSSNDRRGASTDGHAASHLASRPRRTSEELSTASQPPRPILKTSHSSKDNHGAAFSYFSDLSPSASSSFPFGEMGSDLLSRSDSRSSSKSSATLMRRPGTRPRTTSGTSTLSVRSVRFEEQNVHSTLIRRPSTPGGSRFTMGSSSRFLGGDKALDQIMDERLLGCCVELCDPWSAQDAVELKDGSRGPAAFFTAESLRGGLHHSWGSLRGDPLCPTRDFHFPQSATSGSSPGPATSCLRARVWAKRETSPPDAKRSLDTKLDWKLISSRDVDLRELQRLDGDLTDPRLVTSPNMMVLGLMSSLAAQSEGDADDGGAATRADADPAAVAAQLAGKHNDASQSQPSRARRLLEQVVYFAVPLDGAVGKSTASRATLRTTSGMAASQFDQRPATDGFASDPEAPSFDVSKTHAATDEARRVPARDRRSIFKSEEKLAIERSLRETRMMPSYTLDDARALLAKQAELAELKAQTSQTRKSLDDVLGDPQGRINLRLQHGEVSERLRRLIEERDRERRDLAEREEKLLQRRNDLQMRRQRLKEAAAALDEERRAADRLTTSNAKLRRRTEALSLRIHQRQAKLLRSLEDIYPIDLVDGSALLFSIAGIPLPNGVSSCSSSELEAQDKALKALIKARNKADEGESSEGSRKLIYHPLDDDTISTALGLVAQLMTLLSTYLGTPVHYPMATAGSRAVVQDGISIMSGPRAFPLYSKGVERYRYEYAAFLLNKDIEQMMNVHNVTVLDIRHTLPNLKNLIVTVSAAPPASSSTRRRHVGRNEISLISTPSKPSPLADGGDGVVGGAAAERRDAVAQLGLGRPLQVGSTAVSNGVAGAEAKKAGSNGVAAPNGGEVAPTTAAAATATAPAVKGEALKTTRVLGPTKAAPATGDSAIESITKALSFFGSRQS
ncbi:uncharacterized protein PFL1_01308 [Pseudozyma flocculosa PF-1]|uniref:Autophagy-related protein 14 n=1 Tax=Pseudozyma flocculosa TaxID=84751 RepID=A0A5C3EUG9_9BASI|nr:uncharacterized protein PFL1_01308 [Pseudozyma flocculosa PF-1]EPQ31119.1 hypothetical protein PFL1_01308 [Pseudozyma flocculosa PF-1]SPO35983.1 uncharacterized protein PSFLO_01454 [Pseudozyma flocculosa]